ncbi:MAG: cytochrome c5 family protein [Gammaproteobacteria bacterium]|nr:cytochrome c5 family protein [Gammaproteobacteria bacterium]
MHADLRYGERLRTTAFTEENPVNKASIIVIIGLAGLLTACGQGDSAPKTTAAAPVPAAAPAEPATPTTAPVAAEPVAGAPTPPPPGAVADAGAAANDVGKGVFNKTCALCHAAGVAGAPMPGNKEQWAPRIAQGKDMLYKHALEGFTGQAGMMPPRGGNTALTDDEVKAAVDYMVGKSS